MELEIFKLISAGGDVAAYVVIYMLWRFDKRVTELEYKQQTLERLHVLKA